MVRVGSGGGGGGKEVRVQEGWKIPRNNALSASGGGGGGGSGK